MLQKILLILTFVWWTGTMFLLWKESRATEPTHIPDVNIVTIGKMQKQNWYSVYWRGEKIGYSSKSVQKIGSKSMITDVSYMRLPVGGIVQEIYAQSITTVDSTYAVQTFSFDLQSGAYNATAEGNIENGLLSVFLNTPQSVDTIKIHIDGKIYTPSMIPEMFISAQKHKKLLTKIPTFDPFTVSRTPYEITDIQRRIKNIADKKQDVWVLQVASQGFNSEMWISDDGDLLFEKTANSFTQFKESQDEALKFDLSHSGEYDLLTGFAIPARWLPSVSSRKSKFAKYILTGFPDELLELNDFNQKFSNDTLIICSNGFDTIDNPIAEDTAEVPFIQCHDRRIVKAVHKIIKNSTDTLNMLVEINDYLFKNIEKQYQTSIPSALDVLAHMKGDCNEHSTLFAALARSLGIPTRINVGLVYREDGYFFYHAWVQSYTNSKWHSFDPTFGQYPVDASHIKLLSGSLDKQVQLLRIHDANIRVIEAGEKCHR
ncbi:transglutaminase domain-containing protein [bacterium]|nr:transglutaminase domain-containing protein [bacterium]